MVENFDAKKVLGLFVFIFAVFCASGVFAFSVSVDYPTDSGEYLGGIETISWSSDCGDGDYVNLYWGSGGDLSTWNPITSDRISSNVPCSDGSYEWDTRGMNGEDYRIKIRDSFDSDIYDGSDNFFTIDNTDPVLTVDSVVTPTNVNHQVISGTYDEDNLASLTVDGHDAVSGSDTFSYDLDLVDGLKEFDIVAVDLAGNVVSSTQSIMFDNEAPSVSSVKVVPAYANDANLNVAIEIVFDEDGTGLDYSVSPTVTVEGLVGSSYDVIQTSYASNVWKGYVVLNDNDEEDDAVISVSDAVDNTGNVMSDDSNAGTFHVDSIIPDPVNVVIENDAVVTKKSHPTLTLTSTGVVPHYMSFSCDGENYGEWVDYSTTYSGFDISDCNDDGVVSVYVIVKDDHENVDEGANSDSVIYDSDDTLIVGDGGDFSTIQSAINAATGGDTIEIYEGTYDENLVVDKALSLVNSGSDLVIVAGQVIGGNVITIASDGVSLQGIDITNNNMDGVGVYSSDYSDLNIYENEIYGIGNDGNDVSGQGIVVLSVSSAIDDIVIEANDIYGITSGLRTGSSSTSTKAIVVGWSTGSEDITGLVIEDNLIYDIDASTAPWATTKGQGAYGILINHGASGAGEVSGAMIMDNEIYDLEGLWSHAIGLEGKTPGAVVTDNYIYDIVDYKSPADPDSVGVMIEDNSYADSVTISYNFIEDTVVGVRNVVSDKTVNAESNYWGCAKGPASGDCAGVLGDVDYDPWAWNMNLDIDEIDPVSSIDSPSTGLWHNSDITVGISDSDEGGSDLDYCEYQVKSNDVVTSDWTTRSCGADVVLSLGIGEDCVDEGEDMCRVLIKATDVSGNVGTTKWRNFNVDWTAPVINSVSNIVEEADDASGSVVSFSVPTVTDNIDSDTVATCDETSGGVFPLGDTLVTCTHTDTAGNVATPVMFTITVKDTTAPTIDSVSDITEEATSSSGAVVEFDYPLVSDAVSGQFSSDCDYDSGDTFALGSTTVTCNAEDDAGNVATPVMFTITVKDTTAPTIDSVSDITEEATSSAGAAVSFSAPMSHDAVDGDVVSFCDATSGSTFAIGQTTVTCSKTDAANNVATPVSFNIIVEDTTAPTTSDNSVSGIQVPTYTVMISEADVVDSDVVTHYCVDTDNTCTPDTLIDDGESVSFGSNDRGLNYLRYSSVDDYANVQEIVSKQININQLPSSPSVALSEVVYTTDDVVCSVSGSTDADNDDVSYTYAWYKNDALQTDLTSDAVSSSLTAKGQVWKCSVVASDSRESIDAVETSVTIANTVPVVDSLSLSPTSPLTGDSLGASYLFSDTDGDSEGDSMIDWYVDGSYDSAYDDLTTIDSSETVKGQTWYFEVIPNDGSDDGESVKSESVTIGNTLPTVPVVDLNDVAYTDDDLECLASGSTDADGDSVSYVYSWYKGEDEQDGLTGNSVDSSLTAKGEVWTCAVVASDGEGVSENSTDSVVVGLLGTYVVELETSKTKIVADGSSSAVITATLYDGNNDSVRDGTVVKMSATDGSLSDYSGTTVDGQVEFDLVSSTTAGVSTVEVESDDVVSTIDVEFGVGPFGMLKVSSDSNSIVADGIDTVEIIVQMADKNGNEIASKGNVIEFETTGGSLSLIDDGKTNVAGYATAILTAPLDDLDDIVVTAKKGAYEDSVVIEVESSVFDDEIDLVGGKWNLISFPKDLADSSVDSMFDATDKVFFYDSENDFWVYKYQNGGILDDLDLLKSYWVYPSSDKTLGLVYEEVSPNSPPALTSRDLVEGWNMIGYGSTESQSVSGALDATIAGKYAYVLEYDSLNNKWKTYSVSGAKEFTTMKPGYGYWVFMNEAAKYTSVGESDSRGA